MRLRHSIRECANAACGLRYAVSEAAATGLRCPRCRGTTSVRHEVSPTDSPSPSRAQPAGFTVLVDGVRSAFNVGSILRTAEGVGARHVYLCGISPPGDNAKVGKTALGAQDRVPWSYHANALVLATALSAGGRQLWAIEAVSGSESLFEAPPPNPQTTLIVGNELVGVDPDLLALCTRVLHIGMAGTKSSFNVAVAFGIAAAVLANRR